MSNLRLCVNEGNYTHITQMKCTCDIVPSVCIHFIGGAQKLIEIAGDVLSSLLIIQVEWKSRTQVPLVFQRNINQPILPAEGGDPPP